MFRNTFDQYRNNFKKCLKKFKTSCCKTTGKTEFDWLKTGYTAVLSHVNARDLYAVIVDKGKARIYCITT